MTELLPVLATETVEAEVIDGAFFILEANPFKRSENRLIDGLPVDARLDAYVARARRELPRGLHDHIEVWIGEQRIDPQYWRLVTPKSHHLVYVRVRPQGKTAKNLLRVVMMIAIVVAATYFLGPQGGLIAGLGLGTTAAALVSAIAITAATIAGSMLVNALIPAPGITSEPNARDPRFQLTGSSNRFLPYGRIPRVIGKIRMFPLLAGQPYTEIDGKDQYLRMLLVVGWGPLKITDIRIGETSINSFVGAQVEITEGGPAGWAGNEVLTLYNRDVTEEGLNIETLHNVPSVAQVTPLETVEISVDLTFPQGLIEWTKKSDKKARTVQHRVEYRALGSGTWLTPTWEPDFSGRLKSGGIIEATGTTQDMYRLSGRWKVAAGRYEVRLTRLTAAGVQDSSPQIDQSYWTAIRSFADSQPVLQDGLCMIAIRLKATDQLNGVPDRISCLVEAYLPTTPDGTTWTYNLTRNPAWAYADLLRRRAGEVFIPDQRIDLPAIIAWAAANDATAPNAAEPRWTIDAVLEGGSVFENLRQVASIGRAAFTIRDGLYSVVRDVAQATPVQHITPRNSWGYSGSKTFVDVPHALKVEFQNAEKDYRTDELYVYADGFTEANATRFEVLQLFGATSPTLVYREARYHLAVATLRPEEHYVSMDIEALRCVMGSRVELSHDVIVVGTGFGRVSALVTSGANTTGLVLDSPVTFETGKTYQVRVRHKDGTSSLRTATSPGGALGEFDTITIPSEVTAGGILPGDLFMFGETGLVSAPMIVKSIEPGDDLSCRLTLVNYDSAIYTADTGAIPPFTSFMTQLPSNTPPAPPTFAIRSGDTAIDVTSDGTVLTRMAVDIRLGLVSTVPTPPDEALIALLDGKAECGMFDMREATTVSTLVRVTNKAGLLGNYESPDVSNNPTIDATNGLLFDGNSTQMAGHNSITTSDVLSLYMLIKKDATDSGPGRIFAGGYTTYEDGNNSGMAINFTVEGAVRSSFNTLHDVLDDGAWHIMSVTGASINFGTGLGLGGGLGTSMHGYIKAVVIINEASFTAPELTAVRAAAQAYMDSLL